MVTFKAYYHVDGRSNGDEYDGKFEVTVFLRTLCFDISIVDGRTTYNVGVGEYDTYLLKAKEFKRVRELAIKASKMLALHEETIETIIQNNLEGIEL